MNFKKFLKKEPEFENKSKDKEILGVYKDSYRFLQLLLCKY